MATEEFVRALLMLAVDHWIVSTIVCGTILLLTFGAGHVYGEVAGFREAREAARQAREARRARPRKVFCPGCVARDLAAVAAYEARGAAREVAHRLDVSDWNNG